MAQTTITKSPGNAASTGSGLLPGWGSPANAKVKDGNYTSAFALAALSTVNTQTLQVNGYGFAIPVGSTISGVTATITRVGASVLSLTLGSGGSVQDNTVQLTAAPGGVTTLSLNKATGAVWGVPATDAVYGSPTDTWGVAWTTAQINDASFGVNLVASLTSGGTLSVLPAAYVDGISVAVTYSSPVILPVSLTQWAVVHQGNANVLSWQASETSQQSGQFIVERSADGRSWSDLAVVEAFSESTVSSYTYTDAAPFMNGPAYYRLRLHVTGQSDTWSTVQAISTHSTHPTVSLYPNPFVDNINISSPGSFSKVSLHNVQGQTLWIRAYGTGVNTARIPASALPAGIYFVRIDGASYKIIKK